MTLGVDLANVIQREKWLVVVELLVVVDRFRGHRLNSNDVCVLVAHSIAQQVHNANVPPTLQPAVVRLFPQNEESLRE